MLGGMSMRVSMCMREGVRMTRLASLMTMRGSTRDAMAGLGVTWTCMGDTRGVDEGEMRRVVDGAFADET